MPLYHAEPDGLEGINAFYDGELKAVVREAQDRYGPAMTLGRRRLILSAVALAGFMALALLAGGIDERSFVFLVLALMVAGAAAFSSSFFEATLETEALKPMVLRKLASFLGFRYRETGLVEMIDRHRALGLVPDFQEYVCEDGFTCTIDGADFSLTEARLYARDGESQNRVFEGALVSIDVRKEFSSWTVLRRNRSGVARLLPAAYPDSFQVKLEDPRFGEMFSVYSNDQVQARYLLTPQTMLRLLDLAKRHKDLVAAFSDGKLHLAFQEGNCFELNEKVEDLTDPRLVRDLAEELLNLRRFAVDLSTAAAAKV